MKNKTKNIIRVLVVVSVLFALGGCFDVVQHVTRDSAGNIVSLTRFSFDKALFSITEQMSGEPVDYDSMLSDADLTEEELLQGLPAGITATYEPINSPARFGFNIRTEYNDRQGRAPFGSVAEVAADSDVLKSIFFPYTFRGGLAIPFDAIDDVDAESEPFLASSLYTVSVGKSLMGTISEVHVATPGKALGASSRIDGVVSDYEDFFLVEIPLSEFIGDIPRLVVILP